MVGRGSWGHTRFSEDNLNLEGRLDADGKFEGRFLISRDSPIDGGVYLVYGIDGEAVVVDSTQYPEINRLYEIAKTRSADPKTGVVNRDKVLDVVFGLIKETIAYDLKAVDKIVQKSGTKDSGKIALDWFIQEGKGVCRHQGLAVAAILEKFKKDGILRGRVSMDRNQMDAGGHGWARYVNSGGQVYILDVAQDFIGTVEDSVGKASWDYRRPEEQAQPRAGPIEPTQPLASVA